MNEVNIQSSINYLKTNFSKISAYDGSRGTSQVNVSSKEDTLEISKIAYELQTEPKAASGADELTVTKSKGNFVIHFDNSAILNRTVQRGYLELNGHKLSLSDEVKKKLLSTDEEVTKANKRAFMSAVMKHEAEVARQQSDAFKKMSDKQSRVMRTASRIMQGRKVSPDDERELMQTNPELYAMVKSTALLKKQRQKHSENDEKISKQNEEARIKESQPQDYTEDLPEYERSETQMALSFNGSELEVQSITSGTIES